MTQIARPEISIEQFIMHLGTYAREAGIDYVSKWIREERENLIREFGEEPTRERLCHRVLNRYEAFLIERG